MKTIVNLVTCCTCCLLFLESYSQQDPLFTQYMYNMQVVNPAYAGSRDALTIAGLVRSQWSDIEGHPSTQTLSMNAPLSNDMFGVGLAFSWDGIAKTRVGGTQLDLAVRFPTGRYSEIAFGMKGSLWRLNENLPDVSIRNPNDPLFSKVVQSRMLPNVGAGIYYRHERYYFGVSVPELLENRFRTDITQGGVSGLKQRHFYGIAGTIVPISDMVYLKGTTFIKYTNNAPLQVGVTGRLVFHEKFIAGLMYRYNSAVGMLLGFNFTEQLSLGYGFDWSIGFTTGRYNNGSHELALRYDFLFRDSKTSTSPRYF